MEIKPVSGKIESQELNDNFSYLDSISNNPLGAMQASGRKIPLDMLGNDVIQAMTGNTEITNAAGYFENNRGVEYPLRNMFKGGEIGTISEFAKSAILDVKVFGARIDCYYRITFIANGYISREQERWGITLEEYPKSSFSSSGEMSRQIFNYASPVLEGNEGNANWQKESDGIETITVDNGEIAVSVTIDRQVITDTDSRGFLNLNSEASTAIIDPSNYFF